MKKVYHVCPPMFVKTLLQPEAPAPLNPKDLNQPCSKAISAPLMSTVNGCSAWVSPNTIASGQHEIKSLMCLVTLRSTCPALWTPNHKNRPQNRHRRSIHLPDHVPRPNMRRFWTVWSRTTPRCRCMCIHRQTCPD